MAKPTIIKERGTGEELYPHTLASLVRTANGGNMEDELAAKEGAFTLSDDLQMSDKRELSLTGKAKHQWLVDIWVRHLKYNMDGSPMSPDVEPYGDYKPGSDTPFHIYDMQLTESEALAVVLASLPALSAGYYKADMFSGHTGIRAVLPLFQLSAGNNDGYFANGMFYQCYNLEAIDVKGSYLNKSNRHLMLKSTVATFSECRKLRRIMVPIWYRQYTANTFANCFALEECVFDNLGLNVNLQWSPLWSYESIKKTIESKYDSNTTAVTITVHPEVYDKLTDESNTEWHALLAKAAAKRISFATV